LAERRAHVAANDSRAIKHQELNTESVRTGTGCHLIPRNYAELKTHKGASKRFKKTATGKVKRGHSGLRHMLTSKAHKTQTQVGNGHAGKPMAMSASEGG